MGVAPWLGHGDPREESQVDAQTVAGRAATLPELETAMGRESRGKSAASVEFEKLDGALRERLRVLLKQHSQSHIARLTGIRQQSIHRYLAGTRIPAALCNLLVRQCGVNPVWLMTGEGAHMLSDVTDDTSHTTGTLIELVNAMSAVARMRLGELIGQDHLRVMRELSEALDRYQSVRQSLHHSIKPVYVQILDSFELALREKQRGRADELALAAEQIGRLCNDDELDARLNTLRSHHERMCGHPEQALRYARRSFLRLLLDTNALTLDNIRLIIGFLVQLAATGRLREARARCEAIIDLIEDNPGLAAVKLELLGLRSMLDIDLGDAQRAADTMLQFASGMAGEAARNYSGVLVRSMLLSGRCDIHAAFSLGVNNRLRARELLRFAIWSEDVETLKAARERLLDARDAAYLSEEPRDARHETLALQVRCMHELKTRGRSPFLAKFAALSGRDRADPDSGIVERIASDVHRAQLLRLAAQTDDALGATREAEKTFAALTPDVTIDILVRAIHHRNVLELLRPGAKPEADRALREKANEFFRAAADRGYHVFRNLALQGGEAAPGL